MNTLFALALAALLGWGAFADDPRPVAPTPPPAPVMPPVDPTPPVLPVPPVIGPDPVTVVVPPVATPARPYNPLRAAVWGEWRPDAADPRYEVFGATDNRGWFIYTHRRMRSGIVIGAPASACGPNGCAVPTRRGLLGR